MPIVSGNGGGSPVSWIAVFNNSAATLATPSAAVLIGDLVADGVAGADLVVSDDGTTINVLTPGLYVCTAQITVVAHNGATDLILQIGANDLLPNYGDPAWGAAPARSGTQIDASATLTAQFADEFGGFYLQSLFLGGTGPETAFITATVFRLR